MQSRHFLITGGCRCGKSRYALSLAQHVHNKCFVATAQSLDDEMHQRIAHHRAERDPLWETVEEPFTLAQVIKEQSDRELILVDCLTLWVSNWLLAVHAGTREEQQFWNEVASLLDVTASSQPRLVFVTNEVGWGIVPDNALARQFRDWAGVVNQQVASVVDQVVLMVSGIPVTIKGPPA